MKVVGLFAGVGGIEAGLTAAGGFHPVLLCEFWDPARAVLSARFPGVSLKGDVNDVARLPKVDLVTGGFPCTDLSLAGKMAGIDGQHSGLVLKALSLVAVSRPAWLLLENVRNMLPLHGGRAMKAITDELSSMGYRWAYRVVDSRFTGVPQRRQRVIILASRTGDPRTVLFADDAGEPRAERWRSDAFGFYWTEGFRSLGWCVDGTPTLKGGSNLGIPSPPGIWIPGAPVGHRIVTPGLGAAERMQGFPKGWTSPGGQRPRGEGARWKMVGNAVTTGVSRWVGERLLSPGDWNPDLQAPFGPGATWPTAAWGEKGKAWRVEVSMWPRNLRYRHLSDFVKVDQRPLSVRATTGYLDRLRRSKLRPDSRFDADLAEHIRYWLSEVD